MTVLRETKDGLSIRLHRGSGMVLLAFDLPEEKAKGLAGFAICRKPPNGEAKYLPNRLNFTQQITAATTPEQREWTPSNEAPFQKFRWMDFPSQVMEGMYTYEATAMYFSPDGSLTDGPTVSISSELAPESFADFEVGLTRGYLSSQGYARIFKNAPIRPAEKTIDYDTGPYEEQYVWLGFHARKMLFDFLDECIQRPDATVDIMAYDLDEPDFVRRLVQLGPRLRLLLDDCPQHVKEGALELEARSRVIASAGAANVATGHFARFQHNKVLIQRRNGVPTKVLTGSANFSVRGLYVQANNVLVFDDPEVAARYEDAFEEACHDMHGFANSPIAACWHAFTSSDLPSGSVSFAPHRLSSVSLEKVAEAVKGAKRSVFFAVMELGGKGPLLDELKSLPQRSDLDTYGVTQSAGGLQLSHSTQTRPPIVPFAFLDSKVPAPFRQEWRGGAGQIVHHKFVVVDFDTPDAQVFTGSSNLAAGGETENGDNLLAIQDSQIATIFAVEAMRLYDHYRFREVSMSASESDPLRLKSADKPWWVDVYDRAHWKFRDRLLFR